MTGLTQQLGGILPTLRASVGTFGQRLQATPESYRSSTPALWVVSGVLLVFVGLLPFFAGLSDILITQQALYLGLLALSLNLLVATTGLISFGHALFYALGAYMIAVPFHEDIKILDNVLFAFAITPVIGAVAGLVIGLIVFRGKELYFALLTLGAGQLIWAIIHGWQNLTGGTNGRPGVFGPDFINFFTHSSQLYWFIFGMVLICVAMLYVITKSPFGDALRAIRENRRRAEFAGLNVKRYELAAFMIAGMFGSIAGGIHVIGDTQINSDIVDWQRSALALIVILIGGYRYFLGPIAGAFFYWFVFDKVIDSTPQLWDTVLGVIVVGVALLFPQGIVGGIHWMMAKATDLIKGRAPVAEEVPATEQEAVPLPDLAPAAASRHGPASDVDRSLPSVISVHGLTKAFGGLVAVDGASIEVKPRTIHAIIGPNGAGKTTLFNLMTGLLPPDEGTVVLNGNDVTGLQPFKLVKRGLGRSFQQTNLFWELTSLDNVTVADAAAKDLTTKIYGGHTEGTHKRARELLDRVGLSQFAPLNAQDLSHGDQRSLEIATALAVESKLLLLDEPTAGISPAETREAVGLIKRIATENELTVLFVEHDMEVVFGIADWITVLHRGTVLADGAPDEIRANPDVQAAYLGKADENGAS
jgi:ABC-type branched-subunit amino acid transport system ATPase component/ABC-type branched-subunit amino acid transport system permease subunit